MSSVDSGALLSWQRSVSEACKKGDEQTIQDLLREGVTEYPKEAYKDVLRKALSQAVGGRHDSLVQLLLRQGADPNALSDTGVPAIHRAASLGKESNVKTLLEHGAEIDVRDKNKQTAIFTAAQHNHVRTLRLLLDAKADVNARDVVGRTVLILLAAEKPENRKPDKSKPEKQVNTKLVELREEIIQTLLASPLDLEAKDKEERTALLWAASTGKDTLIRYFLDSVYVPLHECPPYAMANANRAL